MQQPIEYDERLRAVSDALQQVEAPGDFCIMGARPSFPPPGIVVDGIGGISLPLTDTTAKALISASHLAPFGHGEHTLVDTQVRNTWELSTSQFKIKNPAFDAFVKDQIAAACRGPLGIHESVVFEAKLYKLLLYETGGKFERHQDSEKENGMFGTLVVVLPGRFEGGELVVHHPSAAGVSKSKTADCGREDVEDIRVFDAGAMDPFSLKYVAFYGDCPHEVRPVTKGYRLCLTYNLVKIASSSTSTSAPQFGSNHALYATMKSALEKFFCVENGDQTKRQRVDAVGSSAAVGFDVTNLESYRECKLVYVLTHKYTHANLSFDNLKNRDAAIAASLARFCNSSDGALGLYLCKMQYCFEWRGDEGTMYDEDDEEDGYFRSLSEDECIERHVNLHCPWVQYNESKDVLASVGETFAKGELTAEVAPCGVFDKKGLKFDGENSSMYTGNEGATCERWYGSAALVVAPLHLFARWAVRYLDDPSGLFELWQQLTETKPAHARLLKPAFQGCTFRCSAVSAAGVRVLDTAMKVDDLDLVCSVLAAFRPVLFQPKFRDVLGRYAEAEGVQKALAAHMKKRSYAEDRFTLNFVASILDGVTDTAIIADTLGAINAVPYLERANVMGNFGLGERDTIPKDFARVLKLGSLVSVDRVTAMVDKSSDKALVLVVAPAIRLLFGEVKNDPASGPNVLAIATHAIDLLKQKLPTLRAAAYKWTISTACNQSYGCACGKLATFMQSSNEEAEFDKNAFDPHLKDKLEKADCLALFSVEERGSGAVVLTKSYKNTVFTLAEQEIVELEKLAAEFVRNAVESGDRARGMEQ